MVGKGLCVPGFAIISNSIEVEASGQKENRKKVAIIVFFKYTPTKSVNHGEIYGKLYCFF